VITFLKAYLGKTLKRKTSTEKTVVLDEASAERFKRLKAKIPNLSEMELISSALDCLEHKSNRIIKRQVLKKVLAFMKQGYSSKEIAHYLNTNRTPTISEKNKWEAMDILELYDKTRENNAKKKIMTNRLP